MKRVLICCGGTGGHLSPGIAVAQRLHDQGQACELVISQKEVDSRLLEAYPNMDTLTSPATGLTARTPVAMFRFGSSQIQAVVRARKHLRQSKADAVLAFGGYVSASYILAARCLRIPVVLHEANQIPGKVIKKLGRFAKLVYVPEGVDLSGVPKSRIRYAGFPLRKAFERLPNAQARAHFGLPDKGNVLVVLGGSQGAQSLNEWAETTFPKLAQLGCHVLCVTGLRDAGRSNQQLGGCQLQFFDFCDAMPTLLSAADLVVARAGAGSLAEFMHCQVPSILVPYPHAADDHQRTNARWLEQKGGCCIVDPEALSQLTPTTLSLLGHDKRLTDMRARLAELEGNDVAAEMAQALLSLIRQADMPASQTRTPGLTG